MPGRILRQGSLCQHDGLVRDKVHGLAGFGRLNGPDALFRAGRLGKARWLAWIANFFTLGRRSLHV